MLPGSVVITVGKAATKQEKLHMRAVASLGCLACRQLGYEAAPMEYTSIHHVRYGQGASQRAPNHMVLPLCARHHLATVGGRGEAFHAGKEVWEKRFGTEEVLLMQTYMMLEQAGDMNLLPNNGGCGCKYCLGGWRELLGVA